MENRISIRECIRFLVSGTIVFAVDFSAYRFLFPYIPILGAKALAYIAGTMTGFFLNKYWTFKSQENIGKEAMLYMILYVCTGIINTTVNKVVFIKTELFVLSYLVATAISMMLNFIGQKYVIFAKKKDGLANEK